MKTTTRALGSKIGPGQLHESLRTLCQSRGEEAAVLRQFQVCAESVSGVMAAVFVHGNDAFSLTGPQAEVVFAGAENRTVVQSVAQAAWQTGRRISQDHPHVRNVRVSAIPVVGAGQGWALVASLVTDSSKVDGPLNQLEAVASSLSVWLKTQETLTSGTKLQVSAAALELTEKLEQCDGIAEASIELVNEVARFTGCQFVVVGLCKKANGRCLTQHIHGTSQLNRNSSQARRLDEALSETVVRNAVTQFPSSSSNHATVAHQTLLDGSQHQAVVSVPLIGRKNRVCGVLLLAGTSPQLNAPACQGLLQAMGPLVGSTLELLRDASSSPARAASIAKRWLKPVGILASLVVAFVAVMFVPVTHRITCDCTVQPSSRRICVAPYDGLISTAVAEIGDTVVAGQLLAEMDSREIRWELASLQAKAAQAVKQRDTEMISGNVLKSQLAELELGQITSRKTMLEARLKNKSIIAPISGIVLTGDLERVANAAVKIGTPIYEIAPLDHVVVEIEVPETEIDFLNDAADVSVVLQGGQRTDYSGTIASVRPQAEIRNGHNVFVALLKLENAEGTLRPGVGGTAKIQAGKAAIGWILFHKAWEKMVLWWPL